MSAIEQYINRIPNAELQQQLREEIERLTKKTRFGLVYENHLPDNVVMPEVKIRRGTKVVLRDQTPNDVYEVQNLTETEAICIYLSTLEEKTLSLTDLVAVAQRGDVIYPYLRQMDSIQNAPDSDLWHTLIEADNYHALQLLAYLYPGMFDCIYIDPPYNKPDSHDWKYNCDYVDGTDSYRHSKWLSMMEARLKIAKKLLNPNDSVMIITIDELEYHHLGCLLEQMFPEAKIQMISSVINPTGTQRPDALNRTDEYIYVVRFGSNSISPIITDISIKEVDWRTFRRQGSDNLRPTRPRQFYPIYVDNETKKIVKVGDPITPEVDRFSVESLPGCTTVFPIKDDGTEMMWSTEPEETIRRLEKGYIRVGRYQPMKPQQYILQYLYSGKIEDIESGKAVITGRHEDGSIKAFYMNGKEVMPTTQWNYPSHNAQTQGSSLLKKVIGEGRFSFPKSLYAVHDVLRFFVANKPNALILDFFAGSGTTLHAVNLLNAEDGGQRRCVMVTNNEIGEPKEKELMPQGIRPGDEEWERWGIARYVNWPRTKCSILGKDVNNQPIEGDYITSLTETKETDRKFTQINFLPSSAPLKQKKSLVTLINKQKDVKLPTMTSDADYLVSEDDSNNASILFDIAKIDEWLEVLEGNDHITNFYIVAEKDSVYKKVKEEVNELMGKIEETVPVKMPMKDGFKANAVFFKLGFLDKRSVARGRQLQELLPLLWMKAGSKGECPSEVAGDYVIWPNNHMALLKEEANFRNFHKEIVKHPEVETVFLITDSQSAYLSMIAELKGLKTYQLYRDYLENFRINYAAK